MQEGAVAEALELQGSVELVTKSELIQAIRDRRLSISERNLTFYASSGLIPPAIRVGSRGGVYPRLVIDQLAWVIEARNAQLSIDAIRELLPLWRLLVRGRNEQHIDLREIEKLARENDLSLEACFKVPFLFTETLFCLCMECLEGIEWTLKDGQRVHHTDDAPLTLNFVLGTMNEETGMGEVVAWTQLALPGVSDTILDAPTTITLGIPAHAEIDRHRRAPHRGTRRRAVHRHQEPLPLG